MTQLLWHKKMGKETPLEIESPDAWSDNVGGCWGEQMILRVEVCKHRICGLTYTQFPRN